MSSHLYSGVISSRQGCRPLVRMQTTRLVEVIASVIRRMFSIQQPRGDFPRWPRHHRIRAAGEFELGREWLNIQTILSEHRCH